MDLTIFQAALSILVSFAYGVGLYQFFKNANIKASSFRLWSVYLTISIFWSLFLTAGQFIQGGFLSDFLAMRISHYSIGILTLIMLMLSYDNFGGGRTRDWIIFGLGWLGLYLFFDSGAFSLEMILNVEKNLSMAQQSLSKAVLIGGWVIIMGEITRFLTNLYRNTTQKILKNQVSYWTLALIFFSIGDGLIFADYLLIGIILHWLGTLIITNVLLYENLPDIRQIEQYILYYLITFIVAASVLVLSIYIALPLFQDVGRENPTFAGAVLILSTAALLSLIWILSARSFSRYLPLISGVPDRILRDYSKSISDILDAERLGRKAIQLICDEFDITHGYLFVVDLHADHEGSKYILKSTNTSNSQKPIPGKFGDGSPIVNQLNKKRRVLKQSDLDIYMRMKTISNDEQGWLKGLNTDIYIPIHTRDEWIGLFALGPKNSDNPYFDKEINLLKIVSDQTAVALNNARLVENLMRLNNDFRRAYKALEQSNAHLRRLNLIIKNLERTKSDFIQIASQELETLLTMMSSYNEILLENPSFAESEVLNKLAKGINIGLKSLEEIIEEMIDIAYIDSRSLQLNIETVGIKTLTNTCIDSLKQSIIERDLTISIENLLDLPQIEADPVALQKFFHYFIEHAIKNTPTGSIILISGQNLAPGELGFKSGGIQVTLSGNGSGIEAEYFDMILTKYSNSGEKASYTSGNIKYTWESPGLSLVIAKGIIEAHRGKIWAERADLDEYNLSGITLHFALPINHYDYPSPVAIESYEQV